MNAYQAQAEVIARLLEEIRALNVRLDAAEERAQLWFKKYYKMKEQEDERAD